MATDAVKAGEEFRVKARKGLSPEAVKRLSELSPLRSTLAIVESWGIVAACVAAALYFRHPLATVAAIVGIAGAQHGLAILVHQSAHYRMFRNRTLNDLVGKVCGWPMGVSMVTYRIIHRIHHNHLYEAHDPDMPLMAGYPRGRAYLLKKLLKDLSGVTSIKNYLYFFGRPMKSKDSPKTTFPIDDTSPELKEAAKRDRKMVLGVQAALLVLAVATGWWREYLLLWVLPLVTVLQMLLRLRAVCEHGAVTDLSTPFKAARTTLAPAWVRFFLYPHSMNFHIEHHLYPSVPHYRLGECHRELVAAGVLDDAEVSRSFGTTLRKIFAERPMALHPRS